MSFVFDRSQLRRLSHAPVFTPQILGAEMLRVVFRTDPEVVAQVLPPPLRPAAEPLGVAFVARYPETNFGVSYNEGALFLDATYRGESGMYCLAMPVDDDMAMVGGREGSGFPKKIAEEITLQRDGGHVMGRVVRKGTEVLRLEGEFPDEVDMARPPFGEPAVDLQGRPCVKTVHLLYKFFPAADGGLFEWPPRLIRLVALSRLHPGMLTGTAKAVFTSTAVDPLGDIPVRDVVEATYGTLDITQLPGRVVHRSYNPLALAPHALAKIDMGGILDVDQIPQMGWRQRRRYRRELASY